MKSSEIPETLPSEGGSASPDVRLTEESFGALIRVALVLVGLLASLAV
jgi:hypothetical protein